MQSYQALTRWAALESRIIFSEMHGGCVESQTQCIPSDIYIGGDACVALSCAVCVDLR